MKLAVVHEWLATVAGSEKVVEQMLETFPTAGLYALVDFLPDDQRGWLEGRTVHTSFIQRLPWARKKFRGYLPLMPLAVEQFDLSAYDVIISSNHAVAKGVVTRADQLHLSYVHSPVRYAWDLQHQYLREARLTRGLRSAAARLLLHYLRIWDHAAGDRVDAFLANSRYVARRVWKTYRRKARVVYPPVDVDRFEFCDQKEDFYVTASRMVPYKRIDLLVEAFRQMPHRRLVVIGDGPDYEKVAAKAGPNVTLLGYQPFDVLRDYVQRGRAFLFAADEDFGIMPVEAQACGTPVLAFGRGGALETVVEGESGFFFGEQTAESVCRCVERFEACADDLSPEIIRSHAEQFHPDRFRRRLLKIVEREWDSFRSRMHRAVKPQGRRNMPRPPARITAK